MMRFKIWDKKLKKWADHDKFYLDYDGSLVSFFGGCGNIYSAVKFEFCHQPVFSTETHDKNGVELFDGDICKCHKFTQEAGDNLGVIEGEKEFTAVIEFSRYGGIQLKTKDGYMFLWEFEEGWHEESLEKIGNRFENPELLEENV